MYKLLTGDCDVSKAELSVYFGGNGDIYVTIYDETGIRGVRLCTSGGPDKEQPIRLAMAQVSGHFACEIEGILYDITGEITDREHWQSWVE